MKTGNIKTAIVRGKSIPVSVDYEVDGNIVSVIGVTDQDTTKIVLTPAEESTIISRIETVLVSDREERNLARHEK